MSLAYPSIDAEGRGSRTGIVDDESLICDGSTLILNLAGRPK